LGVTSACLLAISANANTVTFVTPPGATTSGGPVDASATFSFDAAGSILTISLTDLQANPGNVAQLISDLDFTLSTGANFGFLGSSSGVERTVHGDGTWAAGVGTVSTGWGLNNNVAGGMQLDALGFIGPAHLIIGPPDGSGNYSAANNSIAGNGPHNPFLFGTATFTIFLTTSNADATVTSATFSFGTTDGINVVGVPAGTTVPDAGLTVLLLGGALSSLGLLRRKLR
jgi:hypothetical protein